MKLFEDVIILTPPSNAQPRATLSQSYKMLINIWSGSKPLSD